MGARSLSLFESLFPVFLFRFRTVRIVGVGTVEEVFQIQDPLSRSRSAHLFLFFIGLSESDDADVTVFF